jgi:hypothetical protein
MSIGHSRTSGSQAEHSEDDTNCTRQTDGFLMSSQENDGSDVDTAPTTEDSGSPLSLGDPSWGTPPGQRSRHHGGIGAKETSLDLTVHRDDDIGSNISHLKKVYTNDVEGRARSAFVAQNTGGSGAGNVKPRLTQTVQLGLILAVLLPYLNRLSGEQQAHGLSRLRSEVLMRIQDSNALQTWFSALERHLHDGAAVPGSVNIVDVQHFDLILPPLRKSVDDRGTRATLAASLWTLCGRSCSPLDFSQVIDGISVNPQWGVTEASRPGGGSYACSTCRKKKIRCDPGSSLSKCPQCLESNRECSFEQQQL